MRRILIALLAILLLVPSAALNSSSASAQFGGLDDLDLTEQEETFYDTLLEQLEMLGESTITTGELFAELAGNPALMLDETWVMGLVLEFVRWEMLQQEAQELEPSPRQHHLYVTWLEITTLIAASADDYVQLLDYMDSAAGDAGTAKIDQATALTNDLTENIVDFMEDPNVVLDVAEAIPSPVADCQPFADYNVAQVYYALHPDEQPVIDPNEDGRACEFFFGRDGVELTEPAPLAEDAEDSAPVTGTEVDESAGTNVPSSAVAPSLSGLSATYYVYATPDISEAFIAVQMGTDLGDVSVLIEDGSIDAFVAEFESDGLFTNAEEIPVSLTHPDDQDEPLTEFGLPNRVGDEMRAYLGTVEALDVATDGFAVFYARGDVLWLVMGSTDHELEMGYFLLAVMDDREVPSQLEGFTLFLEEEMDVFD